MNESLLRLFQLVSPSLPVGAFSYSEGLEVLVQQGRVGDGQSVGAWLEAELSRGVLAIEAASLAGLMASLSAWRDGDPARQWKAAREVIELDGWLLAQREAPELRAQQRQMGGSLLRLLADLGWPLPSLGDAQACGIGAGVAHHPDLAWPAAFAWAGLCLELSAEEVVASYLYSWVANQLSAALRLVPLGPTEAQRFQLALGPLIAETTAKLVTAVPEGLWSGGVGAGLIQLGHAELYSRLFRS